MLSIFRRPFPMEVMVALSLVVITFTAPTEGAVASSHSHTRSHTHDGERGRSVSREREEDGAFSPRDKHHFESGAHHSEYDHEAILGHLKLYQNGVKCDGFYFNAWMWFAGSAKEAEEFDNLPPEEAKKRLKILVEKMDLDKNQLIEKAELKAWIVRSFRSV